MGKRKAGFILIALFGLALFVLACESDSVPKPRGYFRIDFPGKVYKKYSGECPFSFEIPEYARIFRVANHRDKPCWINIVFPQFKAEVNISYLDVRDSSLTDYINDSKGFAMKHNLKADAIREEFFFQPDRRVYGTWYDIKGNAASPMQFYLTDSTDHFFRAALYFAHKPNYDSLSPVIDFLRDDLRYMIETFRWEKDPG